MSELELLQSHTAVIDELIRRCVVTTHNNPIGDYTEWLVSNRMGMQRQANSKASYDAVDTSGVKYQIKGRKDEKSHVQFSAIRNLENQGFDFVIAVVFNNDYSVRFALKIPHKLVSEFAKFQEHTNGHILILTEKSAEHPGVIDIQNDLVN